MQCRQRYCRAFVHGLAYPPIENDYEPLDLAVLCRAAAAICGIDSFSDDDWAELEGTIPASAARAQSTDGYWGGRDERWGTSGGRDWFK